MVLIASLVLGELKTDATFYQICDFTYHTSRTYNNFRPDGDARCEHIQFTVRIPDRTDPALYQWFVNRTSMSGCILLATAERADYKKYNKRITFTNALCYAMTETYSTSVNSPREMTMSIVAEKVSVESKEFEPTEVPETTLAFSGRLMTTDLLITTNKFDPTDCFILQGFHYECSRERNSNGIPFGTTPATTLDFIVKTLTADKDKANYFFKDMASNEAKTYTFIFDTDDNLKGEKTIGQFAHGIVARGYIVDIEQSYDKTALSTQETPLLLNVKMLLSSLSFFKESVEQNNVITNTSTDLIITND